MSEHISEGAYHEQRADPPEPEKPKRFRLKQVVEVLEAKPNPMFTEEQRQLVRFLRYHGERPKCAHCGRKQKMLWTSLCSFRVADFDTGLPVLQPSETVYPPLTGVCTKHMMAAETEPVEEKGPK